MPEEHEEAELPNLQLRKAFSSPQERTDFNEKSTDSPFGRPSQQQSNLSQCLLLGPHNLNKLFENKQIIENSETLFTKTGYFNNAKNRSKAANDNSSLDEKPKEKSVENILELLLLESKKTNNEVVIINLLSDLYDYMEKENYLTSNINSKMKIRILKCLYKFVESQNEKLLLGLARIILAVST